LNKVDSEDISFMNLSSILEPFLYAMARCRNRVLVDRIKERIFIPILENNVTQDMEESSDEDDKNEEQEGKWVDGGKLPPKT